MSQSQDIVLAFDLYGTLLSTESIAKRLAEHFGEEKATQLAASWRKYQLEYTWRLNSMGKYEPFSTVTRRSLLHTLAESSLSLPDPAIEDLMRAYDSLSTFPDVGPALEALSNTPSVTATIFSNGTHSMVSNSVQRSADLAPFSKVFKNLVVVEEVKRFKPDPVAYKLLGERMGKDEGAMGDMWLVSGNPFDVVGARAAGMQAAWIDRAGVGWSDGLIEGDKGRPTIIAKDLEQVVQAVKTQGS